MSYRAVFIIVLASFLLVLAIVVPAKRAATRRCEELAKSAGIPHWVLGDRLQCLGSDDGVRWVVLR